MKLSITRLQTYLRRSAQLQYDTFQAPPFTLFFHPCDPLPYFNYAIPDEPCGGDLGAALSRLQAEFAARGRRPRFEFIEEYAPALAAALRQAGFSQEGRQQFMVCTAETYRPATDVPGLTLTSLTSASELSQAQTFLALQRQGFGEADQPAPAPEAEEARQFLHMLGQGRAFVARLDDQAVSVGLYTSPLDGITEVAGLATLPDFRRRGIASALTAHAVQSALKQGVELVCLTAADERAGRVYERVGFVRCATTLSFRES